MAYERVIPIVDITARLRDSETAPADKPPFTEGGLTQVYAIDIGQVAKVTRTPLAGSYLQLVEDQPGGLGVIELPHLDSGPFLSYGIQWIAFGILAPIVLLAVMLMALMPYAGA